MDINKILILVIVILVSIIIVFGVYFLIIFLYNQKHEKKMENLFNPSNLVEEKSLMNTMDEKKNIDFDKKKDEEFLNKNVQINVKKGQTENINPFGIDMEINTNSNNELLHDDDVKKNNKFFN